MSGDTGLHDSRLTDKEAGEFDTLFHDLQCYSAGTKREINFSLFELDEQGQARLGIISYMYISM